MEGKIASPELLMETTTFWELKFLTDIAIFIFGLIFVRYILTFLEKVGLWTKEPLRKKEYQQRRAPKRKLLPLDELLQPIQKQAHIKDVCLEELNDNFHYPTYIEE